MAERARTLKIGGALLALVVAGLVIGFVLVNRGNGTPPNSDGSPSTPADAKTQVEQAYLAFWAAYEEALLKLDPAPLEAVTIGRALEQGSDLVLEQKQKNQPIRIRVEHDYRIVLTAADTASVDDNFISHSVRLDGRTMQPIEPDPNAKIHNSYTLKKVNGKWKVSDIIGFRSSPSPSP